MAKKNYLIALEEELKRRRAEIKALKEEIKGMEEINACMASFLFCVVENKGRIEIDRKRSGEYIKNGIKIDVTEKSFVLSAKQNENGSLKAEV